MHAGGMPWYHCMTSVNMTIFCPNKPDSFVFSDNSPVTPTPAAGNNRVLQEVLQQASMKRGGEHRMLDHIAVTRISGKERTPGAYMLRAELQAPPAADWLARFQSAWYGSPECRKICSNLKTDGASIYIRFRDPAQIDKTVSALRSLVSQTDQTNSMFPPQGHV